MFDKLPLDEFNMAPWVDRHAEKPSKRFFGVEIPFGA